MEEVSRVIGERGPFGFTVRAQGGATRFRGAEMVKCLLDHDATFVYDPVFCFVKEAAGSHHLKTDRSDLACNGKDDTDDYTPHLYYPYEAKYSEPNLDWEEECG